MKLAIRVEAGVVTGSGYHFMMHPFQMASNKEAEVFALMGHVVVEVEEERGQRLLAEARAALRHQIEVACLVEKRLGTPLI